MGIPFDKANNVIVLKILFLFLLMQVIAKNGTASIGIATADSLESNVAEKNNEYKNNFEKFLCVSESCRQDSVHFKRKIKADNVNTAISVSFLPGIHGTATLAAGWAAKTSEAANP